MMGKKYGKRGILTWLLHFLLWNCDCPCFLWNFQHPKISMGTTAMKHVPYINALLETVNSTKKQCICISSGLFIQWIHHQFLEKCLLNVCGMLMNTSIFCQFCKKCTVNAQCCYIDWTLKSSANLYKCTVNAE